MKGTVAIKKYFAEEPHAYAVGARELMDLSKEDRRELGELACIELKEPYELPEEKK